MDDSLFRPVGEPWRPVSPALATWRRIVVTLPLAVVAVALAAVAAVAAALDAPALVTVLLGVLAAVAAGASAWSAWWAGRNQRSWGYAEAEDDLLVTSGVMFRRLVAIPYGRMQFVDVSAGPVERRLGISRVSLHTASTETAAIVLGVPADDARVLRNRLTDLGQDRDGGV